MYMALKLIDNQGAHTGTPISLPFSV